MSIVVQNLTTAERRTVSDVTKIVWYLMHQDTWAIIVPPDDPGA